MNWGSLEGFLQMGGYGLYVWGSYAVTAVLLVIEVIWLQARRRTIMQRLGLIRQISGRNANETSA
ncbi:MAG: heme exporter protein CcmD [Burkholderiales bacterium]|jgi:heme exporter protein D